MGFESRYRPLIIGPCFVVCPDCHRVSEDVTFELRRPTAPMPCCGSTTKERQAWPDTVACTFFFVVQHRDTLVNDGEQVRVVFLAAMLESLLEAVLFPLLTARRGKRQAETVLSKVHGAVKRRELYDQASDKKLRLLLRESGYPDFLGKWDQLIRLRNLFAHGQSPTVGRIQQGLAAAIENVAFKVFAAIHNDVMRQCEVRGV